MTGRLQAEIQQRRPMELREEALLNVLRTADALQHRTAEVLKPFGLTVAQYNVLRILRGAGKEGRTCREISERMLTHDPDVTRMLDRLESRRLVRRRRDSGDRRIVRSRITPDGQELLEQADPVIRSLHGQLTTGIDRTSLRTLVTTLEAMRALAG